MDRAANIVIIDYLYCGSANLSPAAWGKNDDTPPLSFELGVLFTPDVYLQGLQREAAAVKAGRLPPSRFTVDADAAEGVRAVRFLAQLEGDGCSDEVEDGVLDVGMDVPFKLSGARVFRKGATDPGQVPWRLVE